VPSAPTAATTPKVSASVTYGHQSATAAVTPKQVASMAAKISVNGTAGTVPVSVATNNLQLVNGAPTLVARADTGTSSPTLMASHQKTVRRSSPPPELWKKQNKMVDQILITDVTSNNTTITVRECKTYQGFFKERQAAKKEHRSCDRNAA